MELDLFISHPSFWCDLIPFLAFTSVYILTRPLVPSTDRVDVRQCARRWFDDGDLNHLANLLEPESHTEDNPLPCGWPLLSSPQHWQPVTSSTGILSRTGVFSTQDPKIHGSETISF